MLSCSSDSAFADDKEARRSSYGYIMQRYRGPTDRARKLELSIKYQKLLDTPKNQNIETWLRSLRTTYAEASELNLFETDDNMSLYRFFYAIKPLYPAWAEAREAICDDKARRDKKLPTLYEMIDEFSRHLRMNQMVCQTNKRHTHSAFATYQGRSQSRKPPSCG